MATWARQARSDWAAGMGSFATNGLDASDSVKLRQKVELWADGTEIGQPEVSSKRPLGRNANGAIAVRVFAKDKEITRAVFGDMNAI